MKTSQTTYTAALDTYLLPFAKSIIEYAEKDSVFAESLAALIQQMPRSNKVLVHTNEIPTKHYLPKSREAAIDLASWVIGRITDAPKRANQTTATLQVWASDFEEPKDQVFGVVGIAIIGPTLGLVSKKKKKRGKLQIVIDKKWRQELSSKEFTRLVLENNQRLIAKELQLAGGSVYNLHPDSAAWCLEEPDTAIYLADQGELEAIKKAAKNERLSYRTYNQDEILRMVSISPAINDSFVKDFAVKGIG